MKGLEQMKRDGKGWSSKVSAASTAELHVVEGQACAPQARGHLFWTASKRPRWHASSLQLSKPRNSRDRVTDVIMDQRFDIVAHSWASAWI